MLLVYWTNIWTLSSYVRALWASRVWKDHTYRPIMRSIILHRSIIRRGTTGTWGNTWGTSSRTFCCQLRIAYHPSHFVYTSPDRQTTSPADRIHTRKSPAFSRVACFRFCSISPLFVCRVFSRLPVPYFGEKGKEQGRQLMMVEQDMKLELPVGARLWWVECVVDENKFVKFLLDLECFLCMELLLCIGLWAADPLFLLYTLLRRVDEFRF